MGREKIGWASSLVRDIEAVGLRYGAFANLYASVIHESSLLGDLREEETMETKKKGI